MKRIVYIAFLSIYLFLLLGSSIFKLTHEILHIIPTIHNHGTNHDIKEHHSFYGQIKEVSSEQDNSLTLLSFLTIASFFNLDSISYSNTKILKSHTAYYIFSGDQQVPSVPHLPPLA